MSFADTLFAELAKARSGALDGKIPREQWTLIVNETFIRESKTHRKATKPKSTAKMTDGEWIEYLEKEPTLAGIDIKRELGRAEFWIKNNFGRKFTRKFFLNWLSKAEQTILASGQGKSSIVRVVPDVNAEPQNWDPVAMKLFGEYAAKLLIEKSLSDGWRSLDRHYRTKIVEAML